LGSAPLMIRLFANVRRQECTSTWFSSFPSTSSVRVWMSASRQHRMNACQSQPPCVGGWWGVFRVVTNTWSRVNRRTTSAVISGVRPLPGCRWPRCSRRWQDGLPRSCLFLGCQRASFKGVASPYPYHERAFFAKAKNDRAVWSGLEVGWGRAPAITPFFYPQILSKTQKTREKRSIGGVPFYFIPKCFFTKSRTNVAPSFPWTPVQT
jgi:hypothetical protein